MRVNIAELYPVEKGVIRAVVDRYCKEYDRNKKFAKLPTVANIDGCWVVSDGNHRVYAAKSLGAESLDVRDATPLATDIAQMASLRQALADAKSANQSGFENMTVFNSGTDRMNQYI